MRLGVTIHCSPAVVLCQLGGDRVNSVLPQSGGGCNPFRVHGGSVQRRTVEPDGFVLLGGMETPPSTALTLLFSVHQSRYLPLSLYLLRFNLLRPNTSISVCLSLATGTRSMQRTTRTMNGTTCLERGSTIPRLSSSPASFCPETRGFPLPYPTTSGEQSSAISIVIL